jgi:hypothetical protein
MDEYSVVMNRLLATGDVYLRRFVDRVTPQINRHLLQGNINRQFTDELARYIDTAYRYYTEQHNASAPAAVPGQASADLPLRMVLAYLKTHRRGGLALRNFHARDFLIAFFDRDHRYVLLVHDPATNLYSVKSNRPIVGRPRPELTSVTALKESLFDKFDEDAEIDRMMADTRVWNNPKLNRKYYGMSKEQIKALWETIRTEAAEAGTLAHANVENYYNAFAYDATTPEFKWFQMYEQAHVTGRLTPYRTEWLLHNRALKLIGAVDMLYRYVLPSGEFESRDAQGKLHLYLVDWKRTRAIHEESFTKNGEKQYGNKPCTRHVENCTYRGFCIQLQLYKYLLEAEYDVVIDQMAVVGFHPENPTFKPVEWEPELIEAIVQYRLDTVAQQQCEQEAMDMQEFIHTLPQTITVH